MSSPSWEDSEPVAVPSWDESEPAPSALESAGHAAVNNFPMGGQMAAGVKSLGNEKGYSENLKDWNTQTPVDKAAHPIAYGTGAVAGAVAPLLIPGVGEALEAAPIAGNAALGALSAAGNTDLSKNPGDAFKEGAEGAVIGGVVGKAGELLGRGADALKPIGNRLEANATANALDLGTYGVRKLTKAGENPEEVLTTINKKLNELIPNFIGLSDTSASKFEKLLEAKESAGNFIGRVVDSTSSKLGNSIPEFDEAIAELEKAASKYNGLSSARNADARAELNDLVTRMKAIKESGGLNFRALADLKTDIGQAYHNPNLQNHGIDQAYAILSDGIDKVLDRTTVKNPSTKVGFDKAKEIYKLTSNIIPAMKRGVAREVAGTGGGLTSAALGAGAVFGHPVAAAAGYAGKTAAKLAAPDIAPNLAYKTMNAIKNSSLKIPEGSPQAINQAVRDYLISEAERKRATH